MNTNTAPTFLAIASISLAAVMGVYNGKAGCCCGCRGIHRTASAHANVAGNKRGYPVVGKEINDRHVAKILGFVKAHADQAEACQFGEWTHVSVDIDDKRYVVYLTPGTTVLGAKVYGAPADDAASVTAAGWERS